MYPRMGGYKDQDPLLIRDFRIIRRFEKDWEEAENKMDEARSQVGFADAQGNRTGRDGGEIGLGGALNDYLEDLGEDGLF